MSCQGTSSDFDDVGDFHRKFGLPVVVSDGSVTDEDPGPREVDDDLLTMRANFLFEEFGEFVQAIGGKVELSDIVVAGSRSLLVHLPEGHDIDHGKAFDALIDLVYVAYGTAHILGYPWDQGWRLVQKANMAKVRAKPDGSDSVRKSSYDVVKPPGWTPPDIEGLLHYYGWDQM